jgi:hypothetical protein
MSSLHFTKSEWAAAIARGVRQCVVLSWPLPLRETFENPPDAQVQMFALYGQGDSPETLAAALEKSGFDKLKASLFVWLGDAGHRTVDAAICSLAFIASLPKGSAVIFDYAVERTALGDVTRTALDALASRISLPGGSVKYLIQPQAVETLLRGLGFQQVVDHAAGTERLVSAQV